MASAATLRPIGRALALALAACDDPVSPRGSADAPEDPRDAHAADTDGSHDADISDDTDGSRDRDADIDTDADTDTDTDADADADIEGDDPDDTTGDDPDDDADDGDADADADADAGERADVDAGPPALFDMAMISDPVSAACTFSDHRTVVRDLRPLDVWDVRFVSWESIDGTLRPIQIRGYAARPQAARGLPGVVHMHGLGGAATEAMATDLAARLDVFVLAPTGPGGGTEPRNTSEGLPAGHGSNYRLFDTAVDVRGSWFWGHSVAAMRALTCLATHDDVDADRLGMTGFSAGGVASLIAAGVDPRLDAVVALSGTGAWEETMRSPSAWQWGLLELAGLDTDALEWRNVNTYLDPARVLAGAPHAAVMMVNGSTDEFFALNAHRVTYDAVPAGRLKRTSLAANFDHGCYAVTGVEGAATIEARAALHADGAQRMWFGHVFGSEPAVSIVPTEPTVAVSTVGALTVVSARVDDPTAALEVEAVEFWASADGALTFAKLDLADQGGGRWGATTLVAVGPAAVYFVDVTYRTRDVFDRWRFTLSSRPELPADHVPAIRRSTTCLP